MNTRISTVIRRTSGFARLVTLALALLVAAQGVGNLAPAALGERDPAAADVAADSGPRHQDGSTSIPAGAECEESSGAEAEPFVRTELFFGTAKPDGTEVSEADWDGFLDEEITPRFPDGLTVMTGLGQFQDDRERVVQERSVLVILLYPADFAATSGEAIEEIRAAYETAFQQQSVLRSDDATPVCVSF